MAIKIRNLTEFQLIVWKKSKRQNAANIITIYLLLSAKATAQDNLAHNIGLWLSKRHMLSLIKDKKKWKYKLYPQPHKE